MIRPVFIFCLLLFCSVGAHGGVAANGACEAKALARDGASPGPGQTGPLPRAGASLDVSRASLPAAGPAGGGLEGRPVLAIAFQTGIAGDEARLRQLLAIQVNQPYRGAKIRESIERLYATGRFEDIQVDAQERPQGLVLTFIAKENYFIGEVRVDGVPPPPTERQLSNATKLELGELFTEEKLQRATEALRRLLEENGYHRTRIAPQFLRHPETQQVDVRFVVEAGGSRGGGRQPGCCERARIREVRVTGETGFPAQKVVESSGLKAGVPATAARFQEALARIRKFYQNRGYLAARVQLPERRYLESENQELVVLSADAGPRVEVRLRGGALSLRTQKNLLPVYEEGSLDADLIREGSRNLRDYYQSKGYFEVSVKESREDPNPGLVLIEYQVEKGPRHRLDRVEIAGNHFFDEETLRERLALTAGGLFSPGRYSRSLLERDQEALRDLYQANGFHDVKVTAQVTDDYQGKPGLVHVRLEIGEGPQTLVRHLTITGNHEVSREQLTQVISQLEGQPFSDFNATLDRDNVLSYYLDDGFSGATFQWKATVVPGENLMDLEYAIVEGERQYVHQILVGGQKFSRRTVIDQQLQLHPGEPLNQSEMLETQRQLYDLGIFNRVDLAIQNPDGREREHNLLLQVEEAKRWTLGLGGGAEIARIGGGNFSLDNPEGATGFSPRVSLDITRLNVRGKNRTLSFKSRLSTLQRRALLNYTAPRFHEAPNWTMFLSGFYNRTRDVRTFSAQRLEGSVALEQKHGKTDILLYRYSYRRVNVDSATLKISPGLIPVLSQPVRVGMLSASFVRDRRDDPADSHKGMYLTTDLGFSARQVGSEASFNRFLGQYTTYHALGKNLVLARTTQFGLQEPFGKLRRVTILQAGQPSLVAFTREIPLPERFFSGGGSSHRGFSVNQAGPRDPETGFPVGGNSLLLNSVELRFPVRRPDLGGVLFHDMGNVFQRVGDISFRTRQRNQTDFNYMVHAAGAGIRYKTPIGPARLDFAWSFNPPRFIGLRGSQSDLLRLTPDQLAQRTVPRRLSSFQFFFSIGQTF